MKSLLSLFLIPVLLCTFCSCSTPLSPESTAATGVPGATAPPAAVDFAKTDADMFTQRDLSPDYNNGIHIQLNGDSATSNSNSVQISGSTITLTAEGTYLLSGSLRDGMLIVDAGSDAKLQLVFNGVTIHSQTSAALYIRQADKVFLTLAAETQNALSNGGSFTPIDENNIDAALFSKDDLTLNGFGALTVTSPAGHGIVCKDDLVITGGTYTVTAASHGLSSNDSFRFTAANLTVDAGKDGIQSENTEDSSLGFVYLADGTITVNAQGDGISAGSHLQMADGQLSLLTGGGSENGSKASSDSWGGYPGRPGQTTSTSDESSTSMKGLKAAGSMLIEKGTLSVNSADDSFHTDASLTVNGGVFTVSSGDDAFHAEETLTITAGQIQVSESYEGLEALHIFLQGGDIRLTASDDGLNAAGGNDSSGTEGGRDGMFGGPGGRPGGPGKPGGMSANSNGSITISGGTLFVRASGDGIDANGTLTISGGHTTVIGPTRGDTATLDYDVSATISGGTFLGTGAAGMAQTFSDTPQGTLAVSVGNQAAGTPIVLKNSSGKELLRFAPEMDFAVVILSCPQMEKGKTYTLCIGNLSEDFSID